MRSTDLIERRFYARDGRGHRVGGLYRADGRPDIIIRTGGDTRLSNFLLWQASYAELYFTPTLWPDFSKEELYEIFRKFSKTNRRYGGYAEAAPQIPRENLAEKK